MLLATGMKWWQLKKNCTKLSLFSTPHKLKGFHRFITDYSLQISMSVLVVFTGAIKTAPILMDHTLVAAELAIH